MTTLKLELSDSAVEWLKQYALGLSLTRNAEDMGAADRFLMVLAKAVMQGVTSVRLDRQEKAG